MYYCDRDKTGVRVGYKFLEDGSKLEYVKNVEKY